LRVHTSTSVHSLNADRPLTAAQKAAYFTLNWINNQLPYTFLDPHLMVRDFAVPSLAACWHDLPRCASPSRTLSDLFWLTLPWPAIRTELGTIHVLDTGCGSGNYGPRLLSWAEGQIATYTGTDVRRRDEWAALEAGDDRLRFYPSKAESFRDTIPEGTNLFMSQSAIEHFDEDLTFFDQIRDYVHATRGPVLQVHLVPSQACLRLYLLHGVRQYTPRTLSRITQLFAPDAYAVVYRLGGATCNRLHYSFITKPLFIQGRGDRRADQPDEYDRRLLDAISRDMRRPQRSPAFYALVIHCRGNTRIF